MRQRVRQVELVIAAAAIASALTGLVHATFAGAAVRAQAARVVAATSPSSGAIRMTWRVPTRHAQLRVRAAGVAPRLVAVSATGGASHVTTVRRLAPGTVRVDVRGCARPRGRGCGHWSPSRTVRILGPGGAAGGGSGATTPVRSSSAASAVGGCAVFPVDNPWNSDISARPVAARSAAWVRAIGTGNLHPDFGSNPEYGIPVTVVPAGAPRVAIRYDEYGDESDPGPWPVPAGARVEGGAASDGDRHVIVVEGAPACRLYELYHGRPAAGGAWSAGSGATWNLGSNALRPPGWTSADAAGLAILPGLVRYEEVEAGVIDHAIRVTAPATQAGYVLPALHMASSSSDPDLPPMGARLRLRADFDMTGYSRQAQVVLRAMQRYGLIVADNGSGWFFQGASDARWNDAALDDLKRVPGSAFQAIDTGPIVHR